MTAPIGSPAGERLGEVVIGRRFNGPEASANGGYACGSLAGFLDEPAEITLRRPPPLRSPLAVHAVPEGDGVRLFDGEDLIAEGRALESLAVNPPVRPAYEEAVAAAARHPLRGRRHAFSDCFVCGPERGEHGDGLGVTPGPLAGSEGVMGAPFAPEESVAVNGLVPAEIVWATLDCPSFPPSLWSLGPVAMLGRLAARREREIRVGERLAAVGWSDGADGRKHRTASALIDEEGAVVARARATWIELRT